MNNPPPKHRLIGVALAILASFVTVMALVVICHAVRSNGSSQSSGYAFTQYITTCIGWGFVAAYLVANFAGGWLGLRPWAVALGMVAPFPIALLIECYQDPTSHNLFPFEIVMAWLPAYLAAYVPASIGRWLRNWERGTP